MGFYQVFTVIIVLAAAFGYINYRFIKWPPTIGIMVLSMICSIIFDIIGNEVPQVKAMAVELVRSINFENLLLKIMLSFLLYAGASHINAQSLRKERAPIITFATIGVFISVFIIGTLLYLLFHAFGANVGYVYCLLFGAIISPTDPIAVLGILKEAKIPHSLELKIAGESLFNDGVAVVIFISLMEIASAGTQHLSVPDVLLFFVREAGGGLLYGALLGYLGRLALRTVNNYKIEVLITLALVMGGYALADVLHVSGPLAMVMAGIITGNNSKIMTTKEEQNNLNNFWELIDEILNAVLFLLLGFEMLVFDLNMAMIIIGAIAILIVLFARWASVAISVVLLKYKISFEKNAITILTWGGLRGGLSVAMALSLPMEMYRNQFVSITYVIVIFAIIVQGLTIGRVARKLQPKQ